MHMYTDMHEKVPSGTETHHSKKVSTHSVSLSAEESTVSSFMEQSQVYASRSQPEVTPKPSNLVMSGDVPDRTTWGRGIMSI